MNIPSTLNAEPWILALRPATLGLLATLAVALISAAVLLQPQAAEAEIAIVSAVRGA